MPGGHAFLAPLVSVDRWDLRRTDVGLKSGPLEAALEMGALLQVGLSGRALRSHQKEGQSVAKQGCSLAQGPASARSGGALRHEFCQNQLASGVRQGIQPPLPVSVGCGMPLGWAGRPPVKGQWSRYVAGCWQASVAGSRACSPDVWLLRMSLLYILPLWLISKLLMV